jgi:hypothetical protein
VTASEASEVILVEMVVGKREPGDDMNMVIIGAIYGYKDLTDRAPARRTTQFGWRTTNLLENSFFGGRLLFSKP